MKIIELPHTVAERVGCLIQPVLLPDLAPANLSDAAGSEMRSLWQPVMRQLADWKSNPDQLADEGVIAPSRELMEDAEDVVEALCGHGIDPPDVLVINGDGGIILRWRLPGRTWSLELDADGSIESSLLAGSRLLWRHSIHQNVVHTS